MDAIMALARERSLLVVEDCAQAHGARWNGRHVGTFGHAGTFSFCQDKIMTTAGEGGMLITSDAEVWRRVWEYKDHGRGMEACERARSQGGHEFKWIVDRFGTNVRMTEVQSAIGRVQLAKLDGWVTTRRRNAAVLVEELAGVPGLRVPVPSAEALHAYYKLYAYLVPEELAPGWARARVLDEMNARGIACLQGVSPEIYRERAFIDGGLGPAERLPVARELAETSLMLLVDPTLGERDMHRAAHALAEVVSTMTGRRSV
jgi:hypothetical protein